MDFKFIFIVFTVCFLQSIELPKKIYKKVDKEIKGVFALENYTLETVLISEEDKAQLSQKYDDETLLKILEDDILIGYVFLGNAPSKTATFDYLILFDTDLIVTKTKVLIYREEYGGEIGSKRWLKQFIGASKASNFKLHDNIIAISGATISVNSMTNAMNKVLQDIGKLQELKVL